MPRELKINEANKILMFDGMTGEKFWLTHRTVTTDDIIAYQSFAMNTLSSKSKDATEELLKMQLDWGKKLISDVEPGYFIIDGNPIDNTYPGWKDAIAHTASDILVTLARHLLIGNCVVLKAEVASSSNT